MKEPVLRKRLLKDKVFLSQMYKANDSQSVKLYLAQATTYQINTVLHYLHMLAIGKVNLCKEQFATIVRKKKMQAVRRGVEKKACLLYTSPSPRDLSTSRMPSSA